MFKQTFETSATPHITISECLGNLTVRGSEERQLGLRVQGSGDDVVLEQVGETFTLSTRSNCLLTCPPATTLTINTVQGNLQVDGIDGPITINATHGNVQLRNVGLTAIEKTFGNLRAHYVEGDLSAQVTRGKIRVSQVKGSLTVDRVDGNLIVEALYGGLTTEQVRGNIRLESLFSPEQTYRLNALGNLTVYVPPDAGLHLTLRANGGVRSSLPNLTLEETDGTLKGLLGDGAANLEADVSGRISLRHTGSDEIIEEGTFDFVDDLEGLGAQIESRIAESMAEMEVRLDESLGRIDSEQIRVQVERAKEHALRKTGHAAEKARRVAEREAERARMRAERAERRWQRASGRKSRPKRQPATDEERMRVLNMVEEGKITPEQAAELLAALEGR
ncbi:MAG: hypothetical protein GY832_28865 [Chloroflexi bacterium]|nr:hypothetical protein [Chloroflexota bacterium]